MKNNNICLICKTKFTPSKYRPDQRICSKSECQYKRQRSNEKAWREKNPYYFTYSRYEVDWKGDYKKLARQWRKAHPDYMQQYYRGHQEERKRYMREYMRKYREKKRDKI